MLKAAVIGVGRMGQHHARVYHELSEKGIVELVAISDINLDKKELSKKYKCNFYKSYKELLKKEKIDIASICVPTTLHKKVSCDFIKKGVHILIEKPLADSVNSAEKILKLHERNGTLLMVGHIERFNPVISKTKELIKSKFIKNILTFSAKRVGPYDPRVRDVGIIIDSATHDIDVFLYLTSKMPNKIFAKASKVKHVKEDCAYILLDYDNTLIASIEVNWFTPWKTRTLTITTVEKVISINYLTQNMVIFEKNKIIKPKIIKKEPLRCELTHFIDCVEKNKKPLISGYDALKTLTIATAALHSSKINTPIQIDI